MNNVFIYDLENYLPQYKVKNDKAKLIREGSTVRIASFGDELFNEVKQIIQDNLIDNNNNEEDSKCPDWVKKNITLGEFGEELAMNYLTAMNLVPERVSLVCSRKGYDIKVTRNNQDIAYEVKTTTNDYMKFYISYTELKTAEKLKENYNIFLININKKEQYIKGYIINNPIESLDINLRDLINLYENSTLEIVPSNFIIHIKDIASERFDSIDMQKYLK